MSIPELKAVIFDMDGVLIDSEPVWQIAEHKVLTELGLNVSIEDMTLTTGLRIDQVVDYWYARFPWSNDNHQQTAQAIVDQVVSHISADGEPMKGVIQALKACQKHDLKIGLATSSSSDIIHAVLNRLEIGTYFHAINSAEHLAYGKPHPEVYLSCAQALDIDPINCLAIEDSFNGLVSARAACMQTIAIPEAKHAALSKWVIAHQQLNSLEALPDFLAKRC
ncbi:HAD-superfamily hydrolase, subfamily IA, variant 3 [Shewanella halifaxensis HAW-EB4]|uniref:HAD-superfamily hydrolase, subfamily IA, variant 3 n=1 Tax=Shewanella halifaxensis (strain HAW-EB4) TaxID=458817 RepID=B0TR84_SHEHH|nr:hexitol phosphatase HxpB [Shewanella halifaxensis]ABZ75056.1 HAD-superfamily hydrolase, subfamily IA, variant 3 [Shewanella halifaxensis HAW-EB4]